MIYVVLKLQERDSILVTDTVVLVGYFVVRTCEYYFVTVI
jgi:hypothetical protein